MDKDLPDLSPTEGAVCLSIAPSREEGFQQFQKNNAADTDASSEDAKNEKV